MKRDNTVPISITILKSQAAALADEEQAAEMNRSQLIRECILVGLPEVRRLHRAARIVFRIVLEGEADR